VAFPQVATVLDDFARADGLLSAGAGSTIWTASKLGGGSGNWGIASGVAKPNASGANHLSAFTLPADMEIVADIPATATSPPYLAIFFALQNPTLSTWEGYWFYYDTSLGWIVNKRVAGVTTQLGKTSTSASGHTLVAGDKVGIHRVGSAIKIRHYTAGAWNQTPVLDITDAAVTAGGPVALEGSGAWRLDNLIGGAAVAESGGGGGGSTPTSPVTIIVDADSATASDAHTRLEASDPATPVATLQRAAALAYATPTWADDILIKPATVANAADPLDQRVYAALTHNWEGGPLLPFGNNSANLPIVVRGQTGGQTVRVAGVNSRGLRNWVFQDFQQGYDIGSGDDNLTIGYLRDVTDLTFQRITYTGGGYEVKKWAGKLLWQDCLCRSPLSVFAGAGGRFLDGAGFHFQYADSAGEHAGTAEFDGCTLEMIEGQDAIQAGIGGVGSDWIDAHLHVHDCLFHNVRQSQAPGAPHTDSIQILGGNLFTIERNVFIGCDDAILATDYHNGTIRIEDNLIVSGGILVSVQGTDNLIVRHNTILLSAFHLGFRMFTRTLGITTRLTLGQQHPGRLHDRVRRDA
jgi:hypothetical protein